MNLELAECGTSLTVVDRASALVIRLIVRAE
jgi:hypothetical protein